jgi:hypothetical protein
MSEDRWQEEPKDEEKEDDVEAHKRHKALNDELKATDAPDDSDDVEAHRKHKV